MYGWAGNRLRIDLTNEKIVKEPLNIEFAKKFIGGRGFNSKLIYDEFDPSIKDHLSPDNIICIAPGLLSGTTAPSSGRVTVSVGRSPITGLFEDGSAGGFFGPELKLAGYDQIVIRGKAKRPTWIWINNENVELRDAKDLWGKDTWDTTEMIKEIAQDDDVSVCAIGPAGENLVAFSIPVFNFSRTPGGGRAGAIMGSKKLKAIAVRGTKGVKLARPEEFLQKSIEIYSAIKNSPLFPILSSLGTPFLQRMSHEMGWMPVKDWQRSTWPEKIEETSGETLREKYVIRKKACMNCPVACGSVYAVDEGPFAGVFGHDPEYEILGNFGSKLGISDMPAILHANDVLNRLGMDIIQCCSSIATAMHWWQDGLIDSKITGGLTLEWGNVDVALELIDQISRRKGFGAVLADNIFNAAKKIADKKKVPVDKLTYYIVHIKKRYVNTVDLRGLWGFALAQGTSTRGADHMRGGPVGTWANQFSSIDQFASLDIDEETAKVFLETGANPYSYDGMPQQVTYFEHMCVLADALQVCKFVTPRFCMAFGFGRMADLMTYATGIKYTRKEAMKAAERMYNVERAIQVRYGVKSEDDYPCPRFLQEPISDGPGKGVKIDKKEFGKALQEYYSLRGWNNEGIPSTKKLMELDLGDIAQDLNKREIIKERN